MGGVDGEPLLVVRRDHALEPLPGDQDAAALQRGEEVRDPDPALLVQRDPDAARVVAEHVRQPLRQLDVVHDGRLPGA
jgi:hypothetical protein